MYLHSARCYYTTVSELSEGFKLYNEGLWVCVAVAARPPERNQTAESNYRGADPQAAAAAAATLASTLGLMDSSWNDLSCIDWFILYSAQLLTLCSFHFARVNSSEKARGWPSLASLSLM